MIMLNCMFIAVVECGLDVGTELFGLRRVLISVFSL